MFEDVIIRLKEASGFSTNRAIAEMLGMSEQNLSTYKSKKTIPTQQIIDWCINNKVSIDWLIQGSVKQVDKTDELPFGFIKVPFYPDIRASAGGGCTNGDCDVIGIKHISVDATALPLSVHNHKLFAIKAEGDSMSENIKDGSILICDNDDKTFSHGKVFVVNSYGDTFVKRLFKGKSDDTVILHSDNPFYGQEEVPCSAVEIVAKVVRFYNGANI